MYNLFISHSWNYSKAYEGLTKLLDNASYFCYKNYSVPKDEPMVIRSRFYESELKNKIKNQMSSCSVVLILAGVYATYSESIDMEINVAKELRKPIIAIEPWGSEKTSLKVKQNADKIVGWNANSIITAIIDLSI